MTIKATPHKARLTAVRYCLKKSNAEITYEDVPLLQGIFFYYRKIKCSGMETDVNRITLVLTAAAVLAATFTSCGKKDKGEGTGHLYNAALPANPQSLDPQFADDSASATVIKNLYSGLLSADSDGNITCQNALSYEVSPDGLTYSFALREDNYWFYDKNDDDIVDDDEYFPVTADDYVFALRRVLDPKMQSPYARDFSCIKNGEDIIAGKSGTENAGVTAVGDYKLEITLDYPSAEFIGLLATQAAFPCNEEFFDSTKGRYGLDDKSVMSNGAFFVRQWFYDEYGTHNILYMKKNAANENDTNEICPSLLSFSIEKSENAVRGCFKEGKADCISTMSAAYSSNKYAVTSSRATTLGLIFNPKDSCFGNENLRKALAYSLDRDTLSGELSGDVTAAYGLIPPAVTLGGRSYRELSSDKQFGCYDLAAANGCFEKALKELNVGSVDGMKIMVCADTVNSDYLHTLSQRWQDSLGIYLGIEDVTASEYERRLAAGEYSVALYPLSADYNSGMSVAEQFETEKCLESAFDGIPHSDDIRRCATVQELVTAYTSAEKSLLGTYGFIPLFYKNTYLVANDGNEDIAMDAFSGAVDYKLAKNYN